MRNNSVTDALTDVLAAEARNAREGGEETQDNLLLLLREVAVRHLLPL